MKIIKEIRLTYWSPDPYKYNEPSIQILRFSNLLDAQTSKLDCIKVSSHSVIRSNSYENQLSYIRALVNEARTLYPELSDDDIKIIQFGGDSYARTYGIEFPTPGTGSVVPEGWQEISELERTL